MATANFYPDAHVESTSVDGHVGQMHGGTNWATLLAGAGTHSGDVTTTVYATYFSHTGAPAVDNWSAIIRGIFLFDTSILDGTDVTAATFSLYGQSKLDENAANPILAVYGVTPASNTALVNADYAAVAGTILSSERSYANWITSGYNDFTLNTAGLAKINTSGITKFCTREVKYDVGATIPPIAGGSLETYLLVYTADSGGSKPRLTVTYRFDNPDSVDNSLIDSKVSLEAVRNLEIVYGGRAFVDKSGNFVYESRYHRNV